MDIITSFFSKNYDKGLSYESCELLEHGLHLHMTGVKHCCMNFHSAGGINEIMCSVDDLAENYQKIFNLKRKYKNQLKKGHPIQACSGCGALKTKVWDNNDYFNHIIFETNFNCNAKCIYCINEEKAKKLYDFSQFYVLDIFTKFVNEGILVAGGLIEFGGGEPTLNTEFEGLVNLFLDNSFPLLKIHTSGIKYSPAIERCLSEGKGDVIISVDSGSREIYEKIKRVHSFDIVWDNLRRYAAAQKHSYRQVKAKYIFLPGINTTEKEVDNFLSNVVDVGIKSVRFDIEYSWYQRFKNNKEAMKILLSILYRAKNKAINLTDIECHFNAQAECALREQSLNL